MANELSKIGETGFTGTAVMEPSLLMVNRAGTETRRITGFEDGAVAVGVTDGIIGSAPFFTVGNPGNVTATISGTVTITGTVAVTQSTSPWVVSGTVTVTATDLDIRNLVFATDKVDITGSSVSITGSVTVTATDLDIRNLVFATDKVDVGGSAVSITGTVAVTQSGTWNIGTVTTVTTVSTVTSVTGVVAITTSVTPGTSAAHLGKAEDAAHASGDTGVAVWGVRNDGITQTARTGATGDYSPLSTDSFGNVLVGGNLPHDAVDAGAPIKIGGKASTAEPTAVANADRVDAYFDEKGYQLSKSVPQKASTTLTAINITYNATTTASSADIDVTNYRWASFACTLESNGTPTDIQFIAEIKIGSVYFTLQNDFWQFLKFEDTAFATAANLWFARLPLDGISTIRVRVVAVGTDGVGNEFVVTNATLLYSN